MDISQKEGSEVFDNANSSKPLDYIGYHTTLSVVYFLDYLGDGEPGYWYGDDNPDDGNYGYSNGEDDSR